MFRPPEFDGLPLRNEPYLPQTVAIPFLDRDRVVEARIRFRGERLGIFLGPEQGDDFVLHRQCALSEKGFDAPDDPVHPVRVPLLEGLLRSGAFPEPVEDEPQTLAFRGRPVVALTSSRKKFFRDLHTHFQTRFCFTFPP